MTLVFRKYNANGTPNNSETPIEREAFSAEEKKSIIEELQSLGYELECVM